MTRKVSLFCFALVLLVGTVGAQTRAQYPRSLSNAYFGVNIGYIHYPFTNENLEPGFEAETISIPGTAVRLMLYGKEISKNLSYQITYMRPVNWVTYNNVNGEPGRKHVWMNVAGLTLLPKLPVSQRLTLTGEAGLAIITRHGFSIDGQPAMKDANYFSALFGAGLDYKVGKNWDLTLHGVFSPENKRAKQPHTVFFSPGFRYTMRPLSPETVYRNENTGYFFPKNQIKIGFSTNALGYGVNKFFSEGAIPVFWGGNVHVKRGLSLSYQRNVFHTRRNFSLDVGLSTSIWETRDDSNFFTVALYPVFRFTPIRSRIADYYFFYSLAGPTFISQAIIDGFDTGEKFTFHDYMGIGLFFGKNRQLNAEIKIGHYSNGNLFPQNASVKVPLTFAVGYTF